MANWQALCASWSPRALAVLRIAAALLFMQHGTQKLFGFPSDQPLDPKPLISLMGLAGVLELFGGLLVLVGLFTRPVSAVLSAMMVVAYFMAHAKGSLWPVINKGELALLYAAIFFYLAFAGGGAWSADDALGGKQDKA